MTHDPVCGMEVDPEKAAASAQYEGETWFFCSEGCHEKFTAEPEKYIKDSELHDPVCGMQVSASSEFQFVHEGQHYYFCSEHCMHKFREDPEAYLKPQQSSEAAQAPAGEAGLYTCPMHPEVQQQGPGSCPKCGMALEAMGVPAIAGKTEYVCPMHPEVVQDHPGNCPKCGMALEPRAAVVEEKNEELIDMSRRFWVSAVLSLPVFILAMVADLAPQWLPEGLSMRSVQWIEFFLATPVVLWGGWPFFVRGWQSVVTWNLNMFTLIGLGVSVAWVYSVVALLLPEIFPPTLQMEGGTVDVYFEAAAVITAPGSMGRPRRRAIVAAASSAVRVELFVT